MFRSLSSKRGFTLIELLVVIAVIGILASVVLASLNSARAKSRDTARKQALTQVRTALALYYADHGSYPVAATYLSPTLSTCAGTTITQTADWIPGLAPTYIPSLPVDPSFAGGAVCKGYVYRSNGTDYKVMALLSAEAGYIKSGDPFVRIGDECASSVSWWTPSVGQQTYALYTPGACTW